MPTLVITLLLFAVGIVFVVKGGDFFVDAATWIAEVSGIPKLIIGATVVSLATTLPEMLVSIMAAAKGTQDGVDMSIGNAIGSVTANIGLIMAISLIFMPSIIKRSDYLMKSILMLAAAAIIVLCGLTGKVSVALSIVLLVICAIFFYENIRAARHAMTSNDEPKDESLTERKTIITNIIKFIVGTIGIVWGADLLVDNGSELASIIGISDRIIGVTLVAVGTSLPELITTITAIAKKQSALSVGNILGANIIDLTLIMPLSSVISGKALTVTDTAARIDLPACLIVGLIALVPALIASRFRRWQGFVLLAVYVAYLVVTCVVVA